MQSYTMQPASLLPLPRRLKRWLSIALATLDPTCDTIICDSRSVVTNYSKGRTASQALRIFSKENMITLTLIPTHAGPFHPRLQNLNEVTHSLAQGLVNRPAATGDEMDTRDNLTTYNDLVKNFYLRPQAFPPHHPKLNRAQATTLRLLQTNMAHNEKPPLCIEKNGSVSLINHAGVPVDSFLALLEFHLGATLVYFEDELFVQKEENTHLVIGQRDHFTHEALDCPYNQLPFLCTTSLGLVRRHTQSTAQSTEQGGQRSLSSLA
ncbi:hypothetical protein HPB51_024386 [Rhipicephalus microplus]|uniref:Tick transposon n=1 Tax=Rhipicephalus microplus TaxID=6941 RepID=A0A9J6D7H7_RHIMP|nr:hypothetical protein HPB51_024386 [Rhipicephalus microplus]